MLRGYSWVFFYKPNDILAKLLHHGERTQSWQLNSPQPWKILAQWKVRTVGKRHAQSISKVSVDLKVLAILLPISIQIFILMMSSLVLLFPKQEMHVIHYNNDSVCVSCMGQVYRARLSFGIFIIKSGPIW